MESITTYFRSYISVPGLTLQRLRVTLSVKWLFSPQLLSWEGERFQFGRILGWFVGLGGHSGLGKKKICCAWAELSTAGQGRSKCESYKDAEPRRWEAGLEESLISFPRVLSNAMSQEFPWESFWWLSRDAYFNSVWTLGIIRKMPLDSWWGFSYAGAARMMAKFHG